MQWYYTEAGQRHGPLTEEQLQGLVAEGTVKEDTMVWNETMEDWSPFGDHAQRLAESLLTTVGLQQEAVGEAATETTQCNHCGKYFPPDEVIELQGTHVCAECKPLFMQQLREGVAVPGIMEYGGFWIRFAAKFLDGIILGVANMAISMGGMAIIASALASRSESGMMVGQFVLWILQMAVSMSYTALFLGKYGATPGKMACKLKVIRSDGASLTYGRGIGRYFGEMLSGLTLYIGYIMAGFDDEKRSLHDRVCDTRVVKV